VPGIGYTLVVAIPGMFGAAFWTLLLRLSGAPGELLAKGFRWARIPAAPALGYLLSLAGQLYVALCFTALLILASQHHLAGVYGVTYWVGWTVTFFVATAPPLIAAFDWARQPRLAVQHVSVWVTWPLTMIGYTLFMRRPEAMQLAWSWVPKL